MIRVRSLAAETAIGSLAQELLAASSTIVAVRRPDGSVFYETLPRGLRVNGAFEVAELFYDTRQARLRASKKRLTEQRRGKKRHPGRKT